MPKRPFIISATDLPNLRYQVNEALRELSDYVEELFGIDEKQFKAQNSIDLNGFRIVNSGEPQNDSDLATKGYVDENVASSVTGPPFSIDNGVARFDGGAGNLLQNSLATIDDAGSVNIPTGQAYKIGGTPHTHALDDLSDVEITDAEQGDMLQRGETQWVNTHHGDAGQIWTCGGDGADNSWQDAPCVFQKLLVADITAPVELTAIEAPGAGDSVMAYDGAGKFTLYAYADGATGTSPFVVDGWVAIAGEYSQLTINTHQLLVDTKPTDPSHVVRLEDLTGPYWSDGYWPDGYWPAGYWPVIRLSDISA